MATIVKEVMTTDPVCLFGTTTVSEAAERMRDQDIGDVLVMSGETLLGIVTDRDIAIRVVAEHSDPETTSLMDVCSENVTTVAPDTDAHQAAQMMREKAIRRLPVMDEGKPVGVVSLGDLAQRLDPDSALAKISGAQSNN